MSPLTPQQTDAINQALAAGQKIEAIKIYRAATGEGLKEAKDYVEALVRQNPIKYATAAAGGKGCATMLVAAVLVAVAVVCFILS